MKIKTITTFIIICLISYHVKVYSQSTFEFLHSLSDTAVSGLNLYEDEIGNTYFLSVVSSFESGDGILIEGPFRFGSSITKIKPDGTIGFHRFYPTGTDIDFLERGFIPTSHLLLQNDRIILPYSPFSGFLPMSPPPVIGLGYSFKRRMMEIDNMSGTSIETYTHAFDSLVGHHDIRGIYPRENDEIELHYYDEWSRLHIFQTMNEALEIIQMDTINTNGKLLQLDPNLDEMVINDRDSIWVYDLDGNLKWADYLWHTIDPIDLFHTSLAFHENYIAVKFSGFTDTDERGTAVIIYDRFGNQVSQAEFPDQVVVDFSFTTDHQLLLLTDLSGFGIYDTISKPLEVSLLDINLELLSAKTYGFPYLAGGKIKSLTNNQFGVVGVQLTEVLDTEDEAPSSLYLLRAAIDDLDVVSNTEELSKEKITIYPNPIESTDQLNISTKLKNYIVLVYNIIGQLIHSDKNLNNNYSINLEKMNSGIYIVEVSSPNGKTLLVEKILIR